MELEINRLSTFVKYPRNATASALGLARAGFAYKVRRGEIECFSCGWHTARLDESFEDIVKDHARMFPTCQMVKGECGNAKLNTHSETNFLEVLKINNNKVSTIKTNVNGRGKRGSSHNGYRRINSFNHGHISFANKSLENVNVFQRIQRNHNQGRLTSSEDLLIPCVNNTTSESRDESQSQPQTEESHASPVIETLTQTENVPNQETESINPNLISSPDVTNPNASQLSSSYQPQSSRANNGSGDSGPGPTFSDLGIVTEMPKRPEYALKSKRQETFLSWPRDHHLTPEELSEAGFYYAGYGDCARCFFCGGGLRNWEDEDDVWVEHVRWFPKCAYIRGKLGSNFIEIVQNLSKQLEQISLKAVTDILGHTLRLDTPESNIRNDPAVRSVVELGYNEKDVVEVVGLLKEQSIPISADVILEKLKQEMKQKASTVTTNQLQTTASTQLNEVSINELKERNNQLRQQTVCKICLDKDVSVVFLPCGHLVSCTECYIAMRDCPVCRTNIKGTVRAFIS